MVDGWREEAAVDSRTMNHEWQKNEAPRVHQSMLTWTVFSEPSSPVTVIR
ncbi:MAG: hypothetical protein K0R68_3687 [Mycobacterium sp.]|jgi:hypothetical protein|nr:hypothetical protein [Mycobacterium sp.]